MATWTVWVYDVWGNDDDGYTVNDRSKIGEVEIPGDPTGEQINDAIGEYFNLEDVEVENGSSDDMVIEIVTIGDGNPVGQLVIEDD